SCKWTSSARLRSRTLFAAQVAVCPWRRRRHPALSAQRRPPPPARRAGFQSRSPASPESSAHGLRSISHGDANAGACASDGRVRTRPPTSSRRAADARCALSRSPVQDLTLRDGDPELVAGGGKVHVVLCRAGPGSTPSPADRAESTNDRGGHHPASDLGAVEIRQARAFARAAAACVRILGRVL